MGVLIHAVDGSLQMDGAFESHFVDVHKPHGHRALVSRLAQHGVATFDRVEDSSALLRLARSLGDVLPHRDSDLRGVTTLERTESGSSPRRGYLGFSSRELFPHTDGSSIASPPPLVMFACSQPAPQGGHTILVDARALWRRLSVTRPRILDELSRPLSVRFGGEQAHVGSIFEGVEGDQPPLDGTRRLCVRFRWDGLAQCAPSTTAALPALLVLIRETAVSFELARGQGYVVQNGRWLHGRTAYAGFRRVHRVLVRPRREGRAGDIIPFGFEAPSSPLKEEPTIER
jgi:Taurine catabolism dioxygenase TauD, TfdA family